MVEKHPRNQIYFPLSTALMDPSLRFFQEEKEGETLRPPLSLPPKDLILCCTNGFSSRKNLPRIFHVLQRPFNGFSVI